MNEAISKIVHPVFHYGLNLKRQLESGVSLDLEYEQARLKDLLLSDEESQTHPEFGPDHHTITPASETVFEDNSRRMTSRFLGVRYALVCWLDEIFTIDSNWGEEWTENKLEAQLYGSNDRAWRFWEQARQAQTRTASSALETFYLCVNLGFRGNLRDQPGKLRSWCNQTKLRLGKVDELGFPYTTEKSRFNAPPLNGRRQFQKMALVCWLALMAVIPLVSFALIRKFGG